MSSSMDIIFNPHSHDFITNPHLTYDRIRIKNPILYVASQNYSLITNHEYARQVLSDPRFGRYYLYRRDAKEYFDKVKENPLLQMKHNWLLYKNPPDHTVLRSIMGMGFIPKKLKIIEDYATKRVSELIAMFREKDEIDFVSQFAFPLSINVIEKILGLGEDDDPALGIYATQVVRTQDPLQLTASVLSNANNATNKLRTYIKTVISEGNYKSDGMIAKLLQHLKISDEFTLDSVIDNIIFLLIAGHETTMNFMSMAFVHLATNPEISQKLTHSKQAQNAVVDELLRLETPAQTIGRIARERVELGGHVFEKGDEVQLALGAANRDPEVFDNPHELYLERSNSSNHLSFGYGTHYCLGSKLAKIESLTAFKLLSQIGRIRINYKDHRETITVRGFEKVMFNYNQSN